MVRQNTGSGKDIKEILQKGPHDYPRWDGSPPLPEVQQAKDVVEKRLTKTLILPFFRRLVSEGQAEDTVKLLERQYYVPNQQKQPRGEAVSRPHTVGAALMESVVGAFTNADFIEKLGKKKDIALMVTTDKTQWEVTDSFMDLLGKAGVDDTLDLIDSRSSKREALEAQKQRIRDVFTHPEQLPKKKDFRGRLPSDNELDKGLFERFRRALIDPAFSKLMSCGQHDLAVENISRHSHELVESLSQKFTDEGFRSFLLGTANRVSRGKRKHAENPKNHPDYKLGFSLVPASDRSNVEAAERFIDLLEFSMGGAMTLLKLNHFKAVYNPWMRKLNSMLDSRKSRTQSEHESNLLDELGYIRFMDIYLKSMQPARIMQRYVGPKKNMTGAAIYYMLEDEAVLKEEDKKRLSNYARLNNANEKETALRLGNLLYDFHRELTRERDGMLHM